MTKVIEVKSTDLIPDNANANRHTERGIAMVEASLRKRGFRFAGTLDKNNRIVHGNNRHERATDIGLEDVVVIEADPTKQYYLKFADLDLTDPDNPARELAYQANRSAQISIDFEPEQILADLNTGLDMGQFWSEGELNALLAGLDTEPKPDPGPQVDKAAELQEKWGTQTGQVWQLGDHRLACGDCTDKAVVEAVMRGERVEMIWTDPPYGVSVGDKNKFLNSIAPSNRIEENLENDTLDEPGLFLLLCESFDYAIKWCLPGAAWYVAAPAGPLHVLFGQVLKDRGIWRQTIQWVKNNATFSPMGVDYHWQAEPIFYGWLPNAGHRYYGGRQQTTVWMIDRPLKSPEHPTMKPVELVARAIDNSSKTGETIYDPFVGSGTTLIACENLKRKCRAIEIDPGYSAVDIERWHTLTGQQPTLLSG